MPEVATTAESPPDTRLVPGQPRRKYRNCHRVRGRDKRSTRDEDNRKRPNRVQPRFSPSEYWALLQAAKQHGYSLAHWLYRLGVTDAQLRLGLITPDQAKQALAP